MTDRPTRALGWRRWADWSALAVALLALALGLSVFAAWRDLQRTSESMVRGQGEALLAQLHETLRALGGPATAATLQTELDLFASSGLRYVAIVEPTGTAAAGQPLLAGDDARGGHLRIVGERARLTTWLPPPANRPPPPAWSAPGSLPPGSLPPGSLPPGAPPPGSLPPGSLPPSSLPPGSSPPGAPPPSSLPPGSLSPGPLPPDSLPPGAPPPGAPPPGALPPGAPPPGSPPSGWRRPPAALLVIEFSPSLLLRVAAWTNRTVVAGALAALALLVVAVALAVDGRRQRARLERRERDRRLAALGQMSGVMAHELRNPLTSLKGHAQLLEEMLASGSRERDKATLVVHETQRLERLTQDLLAFVQDGTISRDAVTPRALVDRALAGLDTARVTIDLERAPPRLWVDAASLAAALGNLVRNGLQAAATPVDLALYSDGANLIIDVRDHGPGVTPGDEEAIFEPFHTTRVRGTGLGLVVARRAVQLHGGTLTVARPPIDGGALFRISLPRATAR